MGIVRKKGPTHTVNIQPPKINPQTTTSKMKTLVTPIYQLDASAIQAILSQSVATSGAATHGSAQERKAEDAFTDSKVSEGDKQQMKNMCGL